MSDQSWIKEHYPILASEVPEEDALQHSYRKWLGARPEALAKHGIASPPIEFDTDSCALCVHWYHAAPNRRCIKCPLYGIRGVPCDSGMPGLEPMRRGPYQAYDQRFGSTPNPEPMIALIEAAIKMEETK